MCIRDSIGEICVAGTALALGYYRNPEQTAKVFVQNPLNRDYPERIYRTGDLGFYDSDGNLCFAGRRDFQIKHMGHRIELGEIEMLANKNGGVECSCCIFDKERSKMILYYVGAAEEVALLSDLKTRLPRYMLPGVIPVSYTHLTESNAALFLTHIYSAYILFPLQIFPQIRIRCV